MQGLSPLNQEAIKQLIISRWQKNCLIIAVSACTVPLAFAAPAVLNRTDPFQLTGRVLTAIALMVGGGLVVKSACELERLEPQMGKIEAQKVNFLGQGLGAESYVEEERLGLLAANTVYDLTNELDPELPEFTPETETGNPLTTGDFPVSEVDGNKFPVNSVNSVNSEVATLVVEVSQQELDIVSRAIAEGFTDTQIVEEVMGYKGRNYQEGKEKLKQIKKYLGVES